MCISRKSDDKCALKLILFWFHSPPKLQEVISSSSESSSPQPEKITLHDLSDPVPRTHSFLLPQLSLYGELISVQEILEFKNDLEKFDVSKVYLKRNESSI